MKKLLLVMMAILFVPAVARAQVVVHFGWTAPPPLVEVSPGVQVVEDNGDEIFFSGGHYWVQRDGRWYWANDYREHWVIAPYRRVPVFIRNHRPGMYSHWRHADHMAHVEEHRGAVRAEEHHDAVRAEEHHEAVRAEEHHEAVRAEEHHEGVRAEEHHEARHEEERH